MFSNERSERGNMEYEVRKRLVAWLVQEILWDVSTTLDMTSWDYEIGKAKETREKESNPKNIPHEEVFRGMHILWIGIESRIAERNLRNEIRNAVWA